MITSLGVVHSHLSVFFFPTDLNIITAYYLFLFFCFLRLCLVATNWSTNLANINTSIRGSVRVYSRAPAPNGMDVAKCWLRHSTSRSWKILLTSSTNRALCWSISWERPIRTWWPTTVTRSIFSRMLPVARSTSFAVSFLFFVLCLSASSKCCSQLFSVDFILIDFDE